jgi:hypothetical protein
MNRAAMKSRYLVDADLLGVFDTVPTIDLTAELLPVIRAGGLPLQFEAPPPEAADVYRRKVPGPKGVRTSKSPSTRRGRVPSHCPAYFTFMAEDS